MIVDFYDLGWRYPRLTESTYVTDHLGLPWFQMATMVIRAMMTGATTKAAYDAFADEIFALLDWPLPDLVDHQDMVLLLRSMEERIRSFTSHIDGEGCWLAATVRARSTVVFYKVKDVFNHPSRPGLFG